MRKLYFICLSLLVAFSGFSQDQEVELVIASGMEWATCVAISPDNKYVGKSIMNTASIWDVKTGRLIRNVKFTEDLTTQPDSLYFSADNSKLIMDLMLSNDTYEIEVATGEIKLVKGAPMDWSTYQYHFSRTQVANNYLYNTKTEDLVFPSPDGSSELVFRKIKNPLVKSNMMPYAFQIRIRIGKELSKPLDTTMLTSFNFSEDSKYLFANQSIYDLESVRKVSELRIAPFSGLAVMFIPGTHIPVTCGVNTLRSWDFPDIVDIEIPNLVNFKPSLDGKILICEMYNIDKGIREYLTVDLVQRKVYPTIAKTKETGYILDVAQDGSRFCFMEQMTDPTTGLTSYNANVVDSKSGKVIKEIKTIKAFFTEDPDYMIIDTAGMSSFKLNLKTGAKVPFPTDGIEISTWVGNTSLSNKYILGYTLESSNDLEYNDRTYTCKVNIWDSGSGEKKFEEKVLGTSIRAFEMSKDEQLFAFASSYNHTIFIYNFQTGAKLLELNGHTGLIDYLAFSDDGKRLISGSYDGTRRVWNLEKGHEMVSLISTGPGDYAIVTPAQYYYATKGAQKLIHFVKGADIYPFGQFDLKYNRPDIILQSLEASNQDLIGPFNLAYQKRLSRLGFTEEMLDGEFHMPETFISNVKELPISTDQNTAVLNITAKDDKYNLDRLLVRVNEVPVHGKDGLDLKAENTKSFYKKMEVELSSGHNQIAVTVLNEKGVESIAANVTIDYVPKSSVGQELHLFTIGVSHYEQSQFNLTYASKDAEDIQKLFNNGASPFTKVHGYRLTNEEVTLESVIALKEKLVNTSVNDAVCIFYAGHGILDVNLNYFLASYDIDFTDPAGRGIPYETFEDLLDDIPARKKLILIDACHSGEIDKDEVALVESNGNENENNEDITFRAVTSTSLQRVGLNNSFELMKELFSDLRKASGTMIISSAGGMEYAMEGADWNNGVFTYSLLKGITSSEADIDKDGYIMLSEMNTYVRKQVFELTDGRQQPTNRAEILDTDWRLW